MNAQCRKDVECSSEEVKKDGTAEDIGQLRCLEANLVNDRENNKVALNLLREFKKNYKNTAKENMDDNKWE